MKKELLKHLAKICFKQKNYEYRNFLIGILRMVEFENWDNILKKCVNNEYIVESEIPIDEPYMSYDYSKYEDYIKKFCRQRLNMSDNDFIKAEYTYDWGVEVEEYNTTSEELSPEDKTVIRQDYKREDITADWIKKNLDLVLSKELPDYSQESIDKIKEITLELQEINESTLKNINFRILQSKYFKLFTKEQIAQIVSYPVIQDAILNLDDKELECLGIVVNDYIEREKKLYKQDKQLSKAEENEPSQWTQMTEKYLVSIVSGQYTQIISEIGNINDDIQKKELYIKLGYIMSDPNVYEIKTIEQLESYEKIKEEVARKIIYNEDISDYPQLKNMDDVAKKRFAIIQRYGISSGFELSKMFDDDVSQIIVEKGSSEEKQIKYLLAIKELYRTDDPDSFKQYFELLEDAHAPYIPQKYCNQKILEKKLKLLYEKTYNQSLTKIEDLAKISEERRKTLGLDDYEGTVYEAGDNFNFIITSVSPYADSERKIENFLQDWNRKDLKSQLACFSNITSERFRTAPVSYTLLGFDRLQGVDMQAPIDNESQAMAMTPFCEVNWFTLPGNNGIGRFNDITELDAERIMPSYIPVKKKNGKLVQLENTKIAAKQFGKDGEALPLVVIDEDRLIYRQSKKLLTLIEQYREKSNEEILLREISALCLGASSYDGMFGWVSPATYYDLLDDIKKQDFSNTKKFASTCDLSKIVEFINKLPFKEKEENDSDNITHINEETLLKLYHEVPSRGKRDALQVIKDTLDKSENNNKTKEEVGGEL